MVGNHSCEKLSAATSVVSWFPPICDSAGKKKPPLMEVQENWGETPDRQKKKKRRASPLPSIGKKKRLFTLTQTQSNWGEERRKGGKKKSWGERAPKKKGAASGNRVEEENKKRSWLMPPLRRHGIWFWGPACRFPHNADIHHYLLEQKKKKASREHAAIFFSGPGVAEQIWTSTHGTYHSPERDNLIEGNLPALVGLKEESFGGG